METETKKTHDEMEAEMRELFIPMELATDRLRYGGIGGFGQGYSMHDKAREAAPEWLVKWDDSRRWLICFTQGWSGLVTMAEAFGWPKERLLDDLAVFAARSD